MWMLTTLSVVIAVASAADYGVVDPLPAADYAPEKLQISAPAIALITKLLDAVQGYESYSPAPLLVGDGYLAEQSYPDGELLKLLNLLLQSKPKKYAKKATVRVVPPALPGIYGGLPPYGLHPSLLPASYKRPPFALLPPYAPHHLNLVYPPSLPAYGLPLHPAPKPALSPASAYGYPGYAHPALGLPPLPVIVLTKELLDSLNEYEADPAVEAPAPVYSVKPKKHAVKVVAAGKKAPSYASAKAKVLPVAVKTYAAGVKAKPVLKVVKPKAYSKAAAAVVVPAAEDPAPVYAAVATDAPVDLYAGVEARAATGGETQSSSDAAADGTSAKNADSKSQPSSEGGESARASPTNHSISSQKTIS